MRTNWLYMLMAFVMSITLWYMVTGQERVETLIELRLEFKGMPAGLIVKDGLAKKLSVRLRGPKGLMRSINDSQLTYAVDLSTLKKGTNIVPVLAERLPITRAFEVIEVTPSRLILDVDSLAEREVPVEARFVGDMPADVVATGLEWKPEKVRVRGPESVVSSIRKLRAEVPPPPHGEMGPIALNIPIIVPELAEAIPAQLQVNYRASIAMREMVLQRTIKYEDVEDVKVKLNPTKVAVRVELPRSQASHADLLGTVEVRVELPLMREPGTIHLPVRVTAPEGVSVIDVVPDTVAVTIQKR